MKICIAGASGYIGTSLTNQLSKNGHTIVSVNRKFLHGNQAELRALLRNADAVINLAGAPIMQRWTAANKQKIYSSRIDSTINLADAILNLAAEERPKIFISASAVGIYKSGMTHDESSRSLSNDFTGMVVVHWEKASESLDKICRRVVFRIGVVLGKESQTIGKLLPLFKLGLGGKIGSGSQPFPFIHISDLVAAFEQALENPNYRGIYNLVEPEPATNLQFTKALAKQVKRPALFAVPAFALKLLFGKAASMLLQGAEVKPERLKQAGFKFGYPNIEMTLNEICADKKALQ